MNESEIIMKEVSKFLNEAWENTNEGDVINVLWALDKLGYKIIKEKDE